MTYLCFLSVLSYPKRTVTAEAGGGSCPCSADTSPQRTKILPRQRSKVNLSILYYILLYFWTNFNSFLKKSLRNIQKSCDFFVNIYVVKVFRVHLFAFCQKPFQYCQRPFAQPVTKKGNRKLKMKNVTLRVIWRI